MLHLRPVLEGFSCSGNSLVCSGNYFIRLELFPCGKYRSVALDRAVRFNSYKAAFCSETFLLEFDNLEVLRIDFRNYHRNVRCPAVCAVVGHNRCLCLCIFFLDRLDLILRHINCGKYKVNSSCNLLNLVDIHNNQLLYCLRHRSIHFPSAAYSLLVGLACASRACRYSNHLKPRVILQKRNESLTNHSSCT